MADRPSEPMLLPPTLGLMSDPLASVDLFWLPLGAGGNFVRLNGLVYEAVMAALQRRHRYDLYHSALEVTLPEGRFTIEQTPAAAHGEERGVVGVGPIGAKWLADRIAIFHYEFRCWRDGVIPDIDEAVESPRRLTTDIETARRILDLAPKAPFLLWGRDDLRVGDMWNSNSQISWLIVKSGLDANSIEPPAGGRAPGWRAGLVAAATCPPAAESASSSSPALFDSDR
ncbi:MAG TPA: hypothetical protein VFK22_08335 [Candidatus Dormibacteraeota bacterium]|nr:hypothetical protein [Candidatus Dormibacteraeota bacterium]